MSKVHIIGAGIAGAVIAYRYKNAGYTPIVYERDRVMGACWEDDNYQLHPHFFHTDNDEVMRFVLQHTTITPYRHMATVYSKGEYQVFPPKEITVDNYDRMIAGYNLKMWHQAPQPDVTKRITPSNGHFHPDKYQGILQMRLLFENLLQGVKIVFSDVKEGHVKGKIVLTGAIDEYYRYRLGQLPYRGMNVAHLKTESGLPTASVNFPEADFPFLRMIDYRKFGYGPYIGFEAPGNDHKHYPIHTPESDALYAKYRKLAEKDGIALVGRLASFKYQDMDDVIKDCLEMPL